MIFHPSSGIYLSPHGIPSPNLPHPDLSPLENPDAGDLSNPCPDSVSDRPRIDRQKLTRNLIRVLDFEIPNHNRRGRRRLRPNRPRRLRNRNRSRDDDRLHIEPRRLLIERLLQLPPLLLLFAYDLAPLQLLLIFVIPDRVLVPLRDRIQTVPLRLADLISFPNERIRFLDNFLSPVIEPLDERQNRARPIRRLARRRLVRDDERRRLALHLDDPLLELRQRRARILEIEIGTPFDADPPDRGDRRNTRADSLARHRSTFAHEIETP